jgi:hypothetical protein
LRTPYWPLKIQAAKNAVTVVGNTQGNNEAALMKLRPLNCWFIIRAHAKPSTNVRLVVTTTNTIVLSQMVRVAGSANKRWKLAKPT